ncbi:MAG: hypothetical protein ABIS38_02225 [Sphingomicrobium sp.]
MIASHYAEPVTRELKRAATLRMEPADDAEVVSQLAEGSSFLLLDDSRGWAWGYAGGDRLVGYVPSRALA